MSNAHEYNTTRSLKGMRQVVRIPPGYQKLSMGSKALYFLSALPFEGDINNCTMKSTQNHHSSFHLHV